MGARLGVDATIGHAAVVTHPEAQRGVVAAVGVGRGLVGELPGGDVAGCHPLTGNHAPASQLQQALPGQRDDRSITTSGNKEDFVSMGMTAALKLSRMVELVRTVLAIEMMTAGQALEFLRPLRSSPLLEHVRAGLAEVAPPRRSDQPFSATIEAAIAWLRQWRKNRPPIAV